MIRKFISKDKTLEFFSIVLIALFVVMISDQNYGQTEAIKGHSSRYQQTADHSEFPELQKKFNNPHEVTQACITCHNKRDDEFKKSSHWKWGRENYDKKHGKYELGKRNVLNNFCIGIRSNEPRCTSCHAGYGWKDNNFDFSKSDNIDCLVCHDQTGTYKKYPSKAGYPVTKPTMFKGKKLFNPPDYNLVAQSVAPPQRENCGTCHFSGGGGNNVKHGDLEKALLKTNKKVDVHMGVDGENMLCTDCHITEHHKISGKLFTVSSINESRVECTQCHIGDIHNNDIIKKHTKRIACQTCHIPEYAKVNPTKMTWDWSKAGEDRKHEDIEEQYGMETYMKKKGEFTWGKNVKPDYIWFNGTSSHVLLEDKIDPSKPVVLNKLNGSFEDKNSKIIPVKIFRGKQIYDTENLTFIQPKVFGKKGSGAYWADFDWNKAAEAGMKAANRPYSGKFGFVETESYWPINHMVSEKEEALKCTDCHTKNGRLAGLTGFYLLGRDGIDLIDTIALILLVITILGIIGHAILRILGNKKIIFKDK